jgi:fumarylacetoacetate (FAA) hydrolase
MKLGSLKSAHSRDGELIVVSKDNQRAIRAEHVAPSLREAIENWAEAKPKL